MECDSRWNQRAVAAERAGGRLRARRGQASVEYAIVVAGLFAIAVALAALVRAASSGVLGNVVVESLSHRLVRGIADVLAF